MSQSNQTAANGRKWLPLVVLAGITAAITALFTVAAQMSGGFASSEAMKAAAQDGWIGWPIAIHLATAIPALLIGPIILWRRKGDAGHRLLGRVWVALMLTTAIASAFIRTPGAGVFGSGFSFIHIFTIWTLGSVPLAIFAIRKGDVKAHQNAMTGLYIGLCLAGLSTLVPGRLMNNWVFG